MNWRVPRIWEGQTCWILAGGLSAPRQFGVPEEVIQKVVERKEKPSIYSQYFSPIHNEYVIGVNNAYMIGVWIDALFFGDCAWYLVHRNKLIDWPGIKVTCCSRFQNKPKNKAEGIKFLDKDSKKRQGVTTDPTKISWNANSGAAAISLAVHFGVKRIRLLGFDMKTEKVQDKSVTHWHGSHQQPNEKQKTPPFKRHLRGFPVIARDAKELGVEILNMNPNSAIPDFKKVSLKGVLDCQTVE